MSVNLLSKCVLLIVQLHTQLKNNNKTSYLVIQETNVSSISETTN